MLTEKPHPRIMELLRSLGLRSSDLIVLRKSALKVNDTLPTIWIVATHQEVLLCCTHRKRGLWRRLPRRELNAARYEVNSAGGASIRIIFNSDAENDLVVPLPSGISPEEGAEVATALPVTTGWG